MEKGSLKRHKESVHKGVKYNCNECEYQASQNSDLKAHKESVHEGVKDKCNKLPGHSKR